MKTYDRITDLIGRTPLLKLTNYIRSSAQRFTASSNTSTPQEASRTELQRRCLTTPRKRDF